MHVFQFLFLVETSKNPFKFLEKKIEINGELFHYFDIAYFEQISKLPYSIRVLLESALRNCDNFHIKESDVTTILNWAEYKGQGIVQSANEKEYEIPFKPSRVILQDFTGVPAGDDDHDFFLLSNIFIDVNSNFSCGFCCYARCGFEVRRRSR